MSSWTKSSSGGRRSNSNPNGSSKQRRAFRRSAPYSSREERTDDHKDALDSYEELEQMQNYSGGVTFEGYTHQPNAVVKPPTKSEGTPADRRKTLYQKFYKQVQEERKPADCVVLSVTNKILAAGTRAGRYGQKFHRNMPKDQAMDLVVAEYNRGFVNERQPRDPADIAAQASQLLDDFLDREKVGRHAVPSDTRHLLMLLAEGVHLYPEELETITDYVRSRQDYIRASNTEGDRGNMLPPGLGKPPPLLPTPPGPPQLQALSGPGGSMGDLSPPPPPFLSLPGSHLKTKPPPLLSMHHPPSPSLLSPILRGSSSSRVPLLHPPPFHPGSRASHGPRGTTPPSLKSLRPPLLSLPGGPLPRLSGSRH
ncbi:uncharacterized protein LOC115421490 isoform X2 [Sphaeramia orbicularis]|uniref:Nuclear receptor coactivator 5-like n=1 Tax=Sphaeramia orbicularis TaxID=375764 RepID=A0A672ZV59_9TELE|nr:uncharacterized protein LOC115421490 isoform X2 [Sphaeramia orbicularis]